MCVCVYVCTVYMCMCMYSVCGVYVCICVVVTYHHSNMFSPFTTRGDRSEANRLLTATDTIELHLSVLYITATIYGTTITYMCTVICRAGTINR